MTDDRCFCPAVLLFHCFRGAHTTTQNTWTTISFVRKTKKKNGSCRCSTIRRQTTVAAECWIFFFFKYFLSEWFSHNYIEVCFARDGRTGKKAIWNGLSLKRRNRTVSLFSLIWRHRRFLFVFCFSLFFWWWLWNNFGLFKKVNAAVCVCVCLSVLSLRARGKRRKTSRGRYGRNSNVAPLKNQPLKKAGFDSHERI